MHIFINDEDKRGFSTGFQSSFSGYYHLPSSPAQERSTFDPAAQWQVEGSYPSLPPSVQLWTVELGSFAPPQGRKEWSAPFADASSKEAEQQWKLRYCEWICVLCFVFFLPLKNLIPFRLSRFNARRPLAVWLVGPSSFPALPRVLHRPLLPTLATITPPTPQEAPAVWQG